MGVCFCKNNKKINANRSNENTIQRTVIHRNNINCNIDYIPSSRTECNGNELNNYHNIQPLSITVDNLVNETLDVIGTIVDNDPDPPNSILLLHIITDKSSGWLELIKSLIRTVPLEHPLGPSVIALLLDDSPLPCKESILQVCDMVPGSLRSSTQHQRNLCVILGCLAEKMAGTNSIEMLNEITLKYLVENLEDGVDHNITLMSLIALEKFAQTRENKVTINKKLSELEKNPLLLLEKYIDHDDFLLRQIGFCARWCLDNCFTVIERIYSYEQMDLSNINAMLNVKDVSEYLKISPDGLEARCDAYTFESVRCSFQITLDCWYYEVLIITPGVMQIGWATKNSNFLSDDGYGIGDDKYSISFDGCRRLVWHNAKSVPLNLPAWKSGSILGCFLDLYKREIIFSIDGHSTEPYSQVFSNAGNDFFAAASFMSYQQCRFNFGTEPFKYQPSVPYSSFNDKTILNQHDKIILPRHIFLDNLRKTTIQDDSCSLCCDEKATIRLKPCNHRGFCSSCIEQVNFCPMCRAKIEWRTSE